MKKLILTAMVMGCAAVFAQNRELVKPGDAGLKKEVAPAPIVATHPDTQPAPIAHYSSPVALNFFGLSIPSADPLEVYGFRLNISLPYSTPNHSYVYGIDLGFSGEAMYGMGGLCVNLCDNWSDSFSGGAVSLVNVARELHGFQIGLVNVAETGRGIQIGLWNQSDNFKCPIIGVVW